MSGAVNGQVPTLRAASTTTANVSLAWQSQGSGTSYILNGNGIQFQVSDSGGPAANFLYVRGGTAANAPALIAIGTDASVDLDLATQGSGLVRLMTPPPTTDSSTAAASTGWVRAQNYLTSTGAFTTLSTNGATTLNSSGALSSFTSTWTADNPGNGAFQWNITGSVPNGGVIGELTNIYNNGPHAAQAQKMNYWSQAGGAGSVDNAQTLIAIYNPTNPKTADMGAELVRWTVGITPNDTTHNWTHVVEEYNVVNRGRDMGWKAYRNDPDNGATGAQQITGIVNYSPEATNLGQTGEGKNLLFAELFGQSAATTPSTGLPARFYNASMYEPNCVVGGSGRAIYINGDLTADPAQIPYAPLEVNLTWLHGLRTTTAIFQDGAALTMASGQKLAWSTGTSQASITASGAGANQDLVLTPAGTGAVYTNKAQIAGGSIDGTTIGTNVAAAGSFTTLAASGAASFSGTASFGGGLADAGMLVQTPVSGFAIVLQAGVTTLQLTPAGILASGSITLPPTPVNGQWLFISSTQTITALTLTPATGQSVLGAPGKLQAYAEIVLQYQRSASRWICQSGNDARLSAALLNTTTSPASGVFLFGTGADGTVTLSTGTTTLSRDMHYANLTLAGTAKIITNGFRLFVSNTLDISAAGSAAISHNGNTGNNASFAAGGTATTTSQATSGTTPAFITGGTGGAGGNGTTGAGAAGSAAVALNSSCFHIASIAGPGGAGGAATAAGGAGGIASTPNLFTGQFTGPVQRFTAFQASTGTMVDVSASFGGAGGGGGGGAGSNAGGGGGGGGSPGNIIALYARFISRGTNTTTGVISAKGGAGGAGAAGVGGNAAGGGGGSGGPGGFVYIVTESFAGNAIGSGIDVSGGNGGAGGAGAGTGKGGNGGAWQLLTLATPAFSASSFNTAGTAGATTSTSTAASGGAGATVRGSLS
jgi:hypothetical protein